MTTAGSRRSRGDTATDLTDTTGGSYSDRPTVETSVHNRLLTLPGNTAVPTGHGEERPDVPTP
ncbi:hypothetical protein ACFYPC_35215 [Streptomyces sp. NPDC005808]|uniref:hypothetical protein n=1 Tax=Streptomyces sp. NPDC005808 TaxID=3364734 RepID=UPI00369C7191